ncbi:MAG: hypothetical protein KDD36_04465 [Flavobacteriales bacterium]|nr:hypothetical protein [Flavobacteriales bacterium]
MTGICVAAMLALSTCTPSTTEEGISEGVILYSVTYPTMSKQHAFAHLLPTQMRYTFKDNLTVSELKSMGVMKTYIISDNESQELQVAVKFFNDRIASTFEGNEAAELYDHLGKVEVTREQGSKVIAGYKCNKVKVVFADANIPEATLYYTDDINIEAPNWATPFNDIPGVLLQYEIIQNGIHMRFVAEKVLMSKVNDEDFRIPSDYKAVNKAEVLSKMQEISDTFNELD